jgi:CRP-like cAMP-binding protein
MPNFFELISAALLGLATTSSSMLGVAIALYVRFPKRLLAAILAFAAGALISALAIELGYESARELHDHGFSVQSAWMFVGGGFAIGAIVYYFATLFLETQGAAIRLPTRFREYALSHKQQASKDMIALLSKCDLLRHLPPEAIEALLPHIRTRRVAAGEIVFRAGDPADALYVTAHGRLAVLPAGHDDPAHDARPIATLEPGHAFGEMALLSGGPRTATIRTITAAELLEIRKDKFEDLLKQDSRLARAVQRLSHDRAIQNLSAGGTDPSTWARIASSNIQHLTRDEAARLLVKTGHSAGLAIVLGNVLDTIPGCLVIGAKFHGIESLSITLILGMFLGGIPEAAASTAMLRRARYSPRAIFGLWSTVLVAGIVAAVAGKLFIGGSESMTAIFFQTVAGGAVLALVAHAMIPEAIHDGGSVIVLPTVAGFLVALYFALLEALH